MRINEDAYYLVDVSYTKGIVTEGKREGERHTAERTLFNIIEQDFRTKAEAKKHMERNGLQAIKERKLEKYKTKTSYKMMIEDRKRFGWRRDDVDIKIEVSKEKVGWTVVDGYDLKLYFGETWGFE